MTDDTFRPSRLPTLLVGERSRMRPMRPEELRVIATTMATDPTVASRWSADAGKLRHWLQEPGTVVFVVEDPNEPGRPQGIVQVSSNREDPDYESASMDIALFDSARGRGLGPDALRAIARWLFGQCAFHRITIDPAVDNASAIRAYEKVGFQRIGVARAYERGDDGEWHDNLLMDLLPEDLDRRPPVRIEMTEAGGAEPAAADGPTAGEAADPAPAE